MATIEQLQEVTQALEFTVNNLLERVSKLEKAKPPALLAPRPANSRFPPGTPPSEKFMSHPMTIARKSPFDPKDWLDKGGKSYKGVRLCDCPSDYLDMLADVLMYFARKEREAGTLATNKDGTIVLNKSGEAKMKCEQNETTAGMCRYWASKKLENRNFVPPSATGNTTTTTTPTTTVTDDDPFETVRTVVPRLTSQEPDLTTPFE